MSTDMAITLSKRFIRAISQPFDHSQTGISLWTVEDIEDKQKRDREELERAGGFSVPEGAANGNGDPDHALVAEEMNGDRDMRDAQRGAVEFDEDDVAYDRATMEEEAAMAAAMNEPMEEEDL
jgi:DNA excision repair protein ERCC-2